MYISLSAGTTIANIIIGKKIKLSKNNTNPANLRLIVPVESLNFTSFNVGRIRIRCAKMAEANANMYINDSIILPLL